MVSGRGRQVEPVEPGVGVPGVVAAGGGQEAEEGENGGGGDHTVSWTVCWCQSLTGGCGYRISDLCITSYLSPSQILSSHSSTVYQSHSLPELQLTSLTNFIILTPQPPWSPAQENESS